MPTDLDRLQGCWLVAALEVNGQPVPSVAGMNAKITVKGDLFTTTGMGADFDGTLTLRPTRKPRTFDLKFETGPEKGTSSLGIYELKGDTWRICLTTRGGNRPTAFVTQRGTGHALETLARVKGDVGMKEVELEPQDLADFGGEWQMLSGVMDGKALPEEYVKTGKRVAEGNQITVSIGGRVMLRGLFRVDHAASTIDYFLNGGKQQLGIYELGKGRLKTTFAAPGLARPGDFKPGAGRTVTEWQLKK